MVVPLDGKERGGGSVHHHRVSCPMHHVFGQLQKKSVLQINGMRGEGCSFSSDLKTRALTESTMQCMQTDGDVMSRKQSNKSTTKRHKYSQSKRQISCLPPQYFGTGAGIPLNDNSSQRANTGHRLTVRLSVPSSTDSDFENGLSHSDRKEAGFSGLRFLWGEGMEVSFAMGLVLLGPAVERRLGLPGWVEHDVVQYV